MHAMTAADPIPFAPPVIDDDDVAAVERVLRSGWLTTGAEALQLEAELAERLDAPHVVAVSSATAAIEIAYAALDLPAGARVGVPTWTFVSSALAPHHHGAVPVLLDVDEDTLNVSAQAVEAAIGALDALVVVHFGGVPVERAVLDVAERAGVPVIEDTAHAFGARDHRGPMGGRGTVGSCLSFYATKNLTSAEGGALVTHRDDIADFARSFRLHGMSKDAWDRYRPGKWNQYEIVAPGIKANLPDVLAALARSQLRRFDDFQATRRRLVQRYRTSLAGVTGLRFVPGDLHEDGADHLTIVLLPEGVDRGAVQRALSDAGIGTSVHFQPLHRFGWMRDNATLGPAGVETAEAVADRALSLPLSAALTEDHVDRVCDRLAEAVGA
jgi:dTDP-4-amino-4,6-dideoxygalactose transaminase